MNNQDVPIPWVIFDADNTLWRVEAVYDHARTLFCRYVADLIRRTSEKSVLPEAFIDQLQRHRDIQLQLTHGYSAARFARSFEDTLRFLLPYLSSAQDLVHVRAIADEVFEKEAEISDDLEFAIEKLRITYRLGILTAGEEWVQQRRLASFRLRHHFYCDKIVKKKTPAEFERFCAENNVDVENSWVVGDSVSSDIIPACASGLRAIHFDVPNWSNEHGERPDGVPSAKTMHEVVQIILGVT